MFSFDVILFDVGGVLLTNGWDHNERATVIQAFHLDLPAFEQRHEACYAEWDRGAITADQYLDATVFNEPRGFSREEFYDRMIAESKLQPDGAMDILIELVATDHYLIGALNNEARETNDYRFKKFGLRELFQIAISSCYVGLRKPEPAIYDLALEMLCRPAERILFIDDRAENVATAVASGMKAIHYLGADALRNELVHLGVL